MHVFYAIFVVTAAYDMIEEQPDGSIKFVISHHFEAMAKATSEQSHPARVKRIAQETVTLSTSLPLSYSSSVFVRYDSSRLDIMKVRNLIQLSFCLVLFDGFIGFNYRTSGYSLRKWVL